MHVRFGLKTCSTNKLMQLFCTRIKPPSHNKKWASHQLYHNVFQLNHNMIMAVSYAKTSSKFSKYFGKNIKDLLGCMFLFFFFFFCFYALHFSFFFFCFAMHFTALHCPHYLYRSNVPDHRDETGDKFCRCGTVVLCNNKITIHC